MEANVVRKIMNVVFYIFYCKWVSQLMHWFWEFWGLSLVWVYVASSALLLTYESCTGLVFLFCILLRSCVCFAGYLLFHRERHKKKHPKFLELFFYVENNFPPFWHWFFTEGYCEVSLAQTVRFLCGMLCRLFFSSFSVFTKAEWF